MVDCVPGRESSARNSASLIIFSSTCTLTTTTFFMLSAYHNTSTSKLTVHQNSNQNLLRAPRNLKISVCNAFHGVTQSTFKTVISNGHRRAQKSEETSRTCQYYVTRYLLLTDVHISKVLLWPPLILLKERRYWLLLTWIPYLLPYLRILLKVKIK